MSDFNVWAPGAGKVHLVLDPGSDLRSELSASSSSRLQLNRSEGGWWNLSLPAEDERDYAFSIDGGELLPDPRSAWQPYGIHGPSRTLDHSKFVWHDRRWQPPPLPSAILYELHIGTFTPEGTFEGAITKLEHLVRLGITHVELMPVAEIPGTRGWGYDGVDLFAPHHAYGGPEGLKRLVDACHSKGLAILLDVVYNHLGPDGNYLARFGPYFTDKYSTPWGKAVNLDGPGSREVRRFFCDNARMWLRDYHFDGLRLDAVHAIYDSSAIHFLEQLAAEIEELGIETGRHFDLIAENDLNDPRVVTSVAAGGYGFDAQWDDDFHHALHTVLTVVSDSDFIQSWARLKISRRPQLEKMSTFTAGGSPEYRQRIQGRPVLRLARRTASSGFCRIMIRSWKSS